MDFILLSIVLTFVFFFFNWFRNQGGSNNKRGAPEPAGAWPLLGHIKLLPKLNHVDLGAIADKCGPLFLLRLAMHRVLVVNNWEMAKECLITNSKVFAARPKSVAVDNLSYNYALFGYSPYGPYWRQVRKTIMLELLSNRHLDMLSHVEESEVKISIKGIYEILGSNKDVVLEMNRWFGDLSLNVIIKLISGNRYSIGEEEELDRCREALREFIEVAAMLVIGDGLPFLRWLDLGGHESRMKRTAKKLDRLLQGWVDEHRRRRNSGEVKVEEDFIDIMISVIDGGQLQEQTGYEGDTINKATCLTLILGGSETTAITLSWAVSELLNNRQILKKAQDEIDSKIGKEGKVRKSDIDNLVYLQAIIKETLRLHPPATLIPRQTMEDCIVAGFHIPSGTPVLVNDWKIHRDPTVWPEPCKFRPERFLTKHKDVDVRGQHPELIPFGTGIRVCPGISFALQSMHFTLATLLHGFDITTPLNEPVDMSEGFGLTVIKSTPLQVLLTPRLPSNMY